ncbi:MAG: MopE-related protein [bacterium]
MKTRPARLSPSAPCVALIACLLAWGCSDPAPETTDGGPRDDAFVGAGGIGGGGRDDAGMGGAGGAGGMGGMGGGAVPGDDCVEETCNAVDDDCDGAVDEGGCACNIAGDTSCYGGPRDTRGVGLCADGTRGCDPQGELWAECEGWQGPGFELCDTGADEDCDGVVDEGCGACGPDEACDDGIDGDCDGFVDEGCAACSGEEICDNRADEDCDGRADEGCGCGGEEVCDNMLDDDCDLAFDEGCLPCELDGSCAECDAAETCGDGIDNDCNQLIDDGCQMCQLRETCDGMADEDCDGRVDEGCDCAGVPEICADGADNDCDGTIDEVTCDPPTGMAEPCNPNLRRACYGAPVAHIGVGPCRAGSQVCGPDGRWGACMDAVLPAEEICNDGIDQNCDGFVDDCVIDVAVDLNGDCITTRCPAEAPYPVGCNIEMAGGDPRGCVASRPDQPTVYFQEGDACGAGRVRGVLRCSNAQGAGLNAQTCVINKPERFYPQSRQGCPETDG